METTPITFDKNDIVARGYIYPSKWITRLDLIAAFSTYVFNDITALMSGNQTLSGVKTFDSIPRIPTTTPTLDAQAVSKKHLDDAIAAITPAPNYKSVIMPTRTKTDIGTSTTETITFGFKPDYVLAYILGEFSSYAEHGYGFASDDNQNCIATDYNGQYLSKFADKFLVGAFDGASPSNYIFATVTSWTATGIVLTWEKAGVDASINANGISALLIGVKLF